MAEEGNDENRQLLGKDERHFCHGALRGVVTVEPAAFLFILGYVLATSTTQQYVTYTTAEALGADTALLTASLCELTENMSTSVSEVEAEAANVLTIFSLLNILPMLLAAILMGSYSDTRGRKVALVAPIIGGILRGVALIIICLWNLQLKWLYGAALIEGVFGGISVFSTALFSYIADVSRLRSRSWRMLVLILVQALGIGIAEVTAGYMITYLGFIYPFLLILCIYILCLINVICYIRETIDLKQVQVGYFSFTHFVRTFRPLFQAIDTGRRWILRCCTGILLVFFVCQGVVGYSLYLYVAQWPLCFTWVQVGYLMAVTCIVQTLGGALGFRLVYPRFRDAGMLVVSAASGVIAKLWYAVPVYNTVYIFFEPAIGFLTFTVEPITRSLMSKTAGSDEQGAVQAVGAVMNVLGNLLGSVCASALYAQTADSFTGAVWLLAAATMAVILGIGMALHCRLGKGNIPDPDIEDYQRT